MRRVTSISVLLCCLVAGPAFAQSASPAPKQETRMFSPTLVWTGLATAIAGVAIMPSYNFEGNNYTIVGQSYCVSETYNSTNVYSRQCSQTNTHVKVGMYVAIAGGSMLVVGLTRVKVSPVVAPGVAGAKLTVKW